MRGTNEAWPDKEQSKEISLPTIHEERVTRRKHKSTAFLLVSTGPRITRHAKNQSISLQRPLDTPSLSLTFLVQILAPAFNFSSIMSTAINLPEYNSSMSNGGNPELINVNAPYQGLEFHMSTSSSWAVWSSSLSRESASSTVAWPGASLLWVWFSNHSRCSL